MILAEIFLFLILLSYHADGQNNESLADQLFRSVDPTQPSCILNQMCLLGGGMTCVTISGLDVTNCAYLANRSDRISTFHFYADGVIDSNMENLTMLIKMVYIKPERSIQGFNVSILNALGFDLEFFEPLASIQFSWIERDRAQLDFNSGMFDFYYQKKPLETCNRQTYQMLLRNDGQNVFGLLPYQLSFNQVKFNQKLCKFVFQNISLEILSLDQYVFEFVTSVSNQSLNSVINRFRLSTMVKLKLDQKLLDSDVFEKTSIVEIKDSSVYRIQEDLFKTGFDSLRSISFELRNLNGMLHGPGGVAWIKYLNLNHESIDLFVSFSTTDMTRSMSSTRQAINGYNKYGIEIRLGKSMDHLRPNFSHDIYPFIDYQFPDEDFCLYYDIPLERLVLIQIDPDKISCTAAWLYRYQHFYQDIFLDSFNLDKIPLNCDFNRSVDLCNVTNKKAALYRDDPYFLFFYTARGLEATKGVLIDYIQPVACAFGFITNILITLTIVHNHKRRQEIRRQKGSEIVMLEQFLYKYILFNSILNSLYTLMYLLNSTIPCDPSISEGFPSLYETCFVKDYVLDSIGSMLKLVSNFSYIQISINRFLLVGKDHPEWLIKLSQIKIRTFLFVTLLVSVALSTVIYFQNSLFVFRIANTHYLYSTEATSHLYFFKNQDFDPYQLLKEKISQVPLISSFILIHDLFSFFLFCLFSFILDILTVVKLHTALKEKAKVKGKSERQKNQESERKSIMMVVLNSLTNFLFRSPELLSIIFYYIVLSDGGYVFKMLCLSYSDCLLFVNFSNVFYILSLCFQLFFYIKFNSVFRASFTVLIGKLRLSCFNSTKKQ